MASFETSSGTPSFERCSAGAAGSSDGRTSSDKIHPTPTWIAARNAMPGAMSPFSSTTPRVKPGTQRNRVMTPAAANAASPNRRLSGNESTPHLAPIPWHGPGIARQVTKDRAAFSLRATSARVEPASAL